MELEKSFCGMGAVEQFVFWDGEGGSSVRASDLMSVSEE